MCICVCVFVIGRNLVKKGKAQLYHLCVYVGGHSRRALQSAAKGNDDSDDYDVTHTSCGSPCAELGVQEGALARHQMSCTTVSIFHSQNLLA